MIRTAILVTLCTLCGQLPAGGTTLGKLRGTVRDANDGEPIIGAIVKSGGAFTATDSEGCFTLAPKAGADSISFRSMGYESRTLPVDADLSDVRLKPKTTQLRDVIVEAPDIYAKGDTLVFNVERYANAKDNAIIDVIKRLPGIKVEDDGTIKYQGKAINKFYLDGNDFVGGQYGLALNNISHTDVKSVEVMENHQPVKALEGIEFPEEAGINLKLKDDARSRWVGVAQAAAGVQPFLYDGSFFTMRIASMIQNMFTIKADNTGWNPANEIKEHDFDDMFSADYVASLWPEYISADIINAPLSEKRTRDNLSWLANAITAWKTGETSMRLKLNYMGDRLDYKSRLNTDYFDPQIPNFVQNNVQRTQSHDLSAQLYSETNKRGYYLKDKLTVAGRWDSSDAAITGSYDLGQSVDRKLFSAINELKLVKRNDKRLLTLISRLAFNHSPDRLIVSGRGDALQRVGTTDFRSTTETKIGKLTRFLKYYLTAGADLNYHRMNSTLAGLGSFDNSGIHESFLAGLYATPQIDYDRSDWKMTLRVPLKWQHYSIDGNYDYVEVSPQVSVRRQLTSKSELSAATSWHLTAPRPYMFINVPVMADYHNIFAAANAGSYSRHLASSMTYRYRNPLKSFFATLSASYSQSRNSMMSHQLFIGDYIISTYDDRFSISDTWSVSGSVSKGLGHSRMVVGVESNALISSASSMRDNSVIPYRQTTIAVKPYFKGSIVKWMSLNYEADYRFTRLHKGDVGNTSHSLHQNLFVTFLPDDRLQFTAGAEHFLTRFPEGNTTNLVLLDASVVWRINDKTRLSLTGNNLLDKRRYEYVTFGTLSRSEHSFGIRQRMILASVQYRF